MARSPCLCQRVSQILCQSADISIPQCCRAHVSQKYTTISKDIEHRQYEPTLRQFCVLGPEPPTSTSAQPTTHVCEDGEIQCEVKFKNSESSKTSFLLKFSLCWEYALAPNLSETLVQTVWI